MFINFFKAAFGVFFAYALVCGIALAVSFGSIALLLYLILG